MLELIGNTGRTSRRFGDRNIHTGGTETDGQAFSYFIIGRDKLVEYEGHSVPAIDVLKAKATGESFRRVWFFPTECG